MTAPWNETSRTLPAGLTCAQCMSGAFCAKTFDRKPEDTTCVWETGRFRLKVEVYQEAVAGLAAYRGALEAFHCCERCEDREYFVDREGTDADMCRIRLAAHDLLASPDPGQAILARLKLGEDLNRTLTAYLELAHEGAAMDTVRVGFVALWGDVKRAKTAYDKAVTP